MMMMLEYDEPEDDGKKDDDEGAGDDEIIVSSSGIEVISSSSPSYSGLVSARSLPMSTTSYNTNDTISVPCVSSSFWFASLELCS
jgi:hypothetical protein